MNEVNKNNWTKLSDFLKGLNVIPLILLVSGYHYYRALSALNEPWFTAFPTAVIVDVTHYGTVERFRDAETKGARFGWGIACFLCTFLGIWLKYSFYSQGLDGFSLEAARNALLIPTMVVIFGFLEGKQEEEEAQEEAAPEPQADTEKVMEMLTATLLAELKPKQTNMVKVLHMVGDGMNPAQIAEQLEVTPATVGRYMKALNGAVASHE